MIYTSDHGDNLGNRGLWGKSVMYEELAAVPLIAAGPDIQAGTVVDTPVSLVDCYRSILEAVGCPLPEDDGSALRSLWSIAAGERPDRNVLQRVPRCRLGHRLFHDPPRPLEIHPSCRLPAGAVRPRRRPRRNRDLAERPAMARFWRSARRGFARSAIPTPSTRKPSPTSAA